MATIGHKVSQETKEKIRKTLLGRKASTKTRLKQSKAHIKRFQNPEERKRISELIKLNLPSTIWKKGHKTWNKGKKLPQISGNKHPQWKGGRVKHGDGYILIHNPDHPRAHNSYILEHILVAERKLGRFLILGEIVHHLDFNRGNNKEDNLHVFENNPNHMKYHKFLRDCIKEVIG